MTTTNIFIIVTIAIILICDFVRLMIKEITLHQFMTTVLLSIIVFKLL